MLIAGAFARRKCALRPGRGASYFPSAQSVTFRKPGGAEAADYVPGRRDLVRDRGRVITRLPGNEVGLRRGLHVAHDILGRAIREKPDLGAIELE